MNETWSPSAKSPDQDIRLQFVVNMKCEPESPSALFLETGFRYVTLGRVEILECRSEPEGLSARKIEPQVWVLPPEERPRGTAAE